MSMCSNCNKDTAQYAPVGPIIVTLKDPEFIGPDGLQEVFCCWQCAAEWFEAQDPREVEMTLFNVA
jgi:hypothetical protein